MLSRLSSKLGSKRQLLFGTTSMALLGLMKSSEKITLQEAQGLKKKKKKRKKKDNDYFFPFTVTIDEEKRLSDLWKIYAAQPQLNQEQFIEVYKKMVPTGKKRKRVMERENNFFPCF
jgi:hypothetical protein